MKKWKQAKDDFIMAERVVDAVRLEMEWTAAEHFYGKKVATTMKKLLPADPLFLRDLMIYGFEGEGVPEKEIQKMLEEYTVENWEEELQNSLPHIKNLLNEVRSHSVIEGM